MCVGQVVEDAYQLRCGREGVVSQLERSHGSGGTGPTAVSHPPDAQTPTSAFRPWSSPVLTFR